MAWDPKKKSGKILQAVLRVGGGVLGLVTGLNVGSAALGAVGRVVTKGTAALAKTDGVLSQISGATDNVATASKLLQSKVQKKINAAVKAEKKSAEVATAELAAGTDTTATPGTMKDFFSGQTGKYVLFGAAGIAALFILPKLLKR